MARSFYSPSSGQGASRLRGINGRGFQRMRARESHYQELRELKAFFRAWCGYRWNRWVEPEARLYHGEISKVLRRRASFNRTLLPRLRLVRTRMMERAGLQEPCAPSKKSARASTVTPDLRSLASSG